MDATLPSRGANRYTELTAFAHTLLQIDENTGFKVSSRGWAWLQISTPLCKRFTACPDHGTEMTRAAFEAIKATSQRYADVI